MPGSSAPDPPTPTIGVGLVEDDRTTRDGLAALVGGTPGYRCVGSFASVEDAVRRATTGPDVWLLDIHLPGMSGTEGVTALRARFPASEILMLTALSNDGAVFASICNGAVGYLLKKTPPSRLLEAIREAAQGGAPMSPEIARRVVTLFRATMPAPPTEALTAQELRLLQELAAGHSYHAAAATLGISINTVRGYIRTVYGKLHVHSKSAAVGKALRLRLIE